MKEVKLSDQNQINELAQFILKTAQSKGASQSEVDISANKGFSVGVHDGNVETVEYHQDKSIEITVYFGQRSGSASLSDVRPEAVIKAVEAACHIAKYTDVDSASGLADLDQLAFNYPILETYFPWDLSVERAIEMACACEKTALQLDKRIKSAEEVRIATIESKSLYANSLGFVGFIPSSHHEISCVLVAQNSNEMQRDYSYSVTVDPKDLSSLDELAQEAVKRTIARLGAKRMATTKAPVIFVAQEARGLLGHFASAISGSHIYRKSSFLLDHLDTQIFPAFINIYEQPFLPKGLGSSPFDDDGVATRENKFIENGILKKYALSTYAARKLKMKPTGNAGGMHNLTITPCNKNFLDLVKEMGHGLIVTELMGQGVNLVTGDYSRGVGGYWVEGGEIQYPVHEITVAGNLKDIYKNILAVGNDIDTRGNVRTGSILIAEMMIAGN